MKWVGPVKIRDLLSRCMDDSCPRPPESNSVYLVSGKAWVKNPSGKCIPLYIGSNTGRSKRFRTRIGDLIADIFGFFSTDTGHHSGGQTLHKHFKKKKLDPLNVYIAWLKECSCMRCAENEMYDKFKATLLNKNRPARCIKC